MLEEEGLVNGTVLWGQVEALSSVCFVSEPCWSLMRQARGLNENSISD